MKIQPTDPAVGVESFCIAATVLFATWTVCANLTVWLQGSLLHLLGLYGVTCLLVAAMIVALNAREEASKRGESGRARLQEEEDAGGEVSSGASRALSSAGLPQSLSRGLAENLMLALSVVAALLIFRGSSVMTNWFVLEGALLMGGLLLLARGEFSCIRLERPSGFGNRAIWGLAACSALLALVVHRSDYDDSLYVNFAVAALDSPTSALLDQETLHGIDRLPLTLPIYKVHSYELWNAAVSLLTGIPPIESFHWIAAAVAAFLIPLAYATLFRLLTPKQWFWSVAILLPILFLVGGPHRWLANFAVVRIFQGKSIFLSVFLPLIYAFSIRFMTSPSLARWSLLSMAQIAALGLTSSAAWCGPFAAVFAALTTWVPGTRFLRRLLLVPLSAFYTILVAVSFRGEMETMMKPTKPTAAAARLDQAVAEVLGDGALLTVSLIVLCVGWVLCRSPMARRFALVMPLLWASLLFNPFLVDQIVGRVTGPPYWRVFWALPLPAFLALAIVSPLDWRIPALRPAARRVLVATGLVFCLLVVPESWALSGENRVSLGWPRLKVPYAWIWAKRVQQQVDPGAEVLVPDSVGLWLPTFRHHPYPQMVRHYLRPQAARIGKEEFRRRRDATRFVAGAPFGKARSESAFLETLKRPAVQAVVFENMEPVDASRRTLRKQGFRLRMSLHGRQLWLRSRRPARSSGHLAEPASGGEAKTASGAGHIYSQNFEKGLDIEFFDGTPEEGVQPTR